MCENTCAVLLEPLVKLSLNRQFDFWEWLLVSHANLVTHLCIKFELYVANINHCYKCVE
jgi:hypothetical protein